MSVSGIQPNKPKTNTSSTNNQIESNQKPETLDLADLDLSRLRLTKKDLETLSSITPDLPKHFQDQLLAQLPPNQARKLSRTLSMQNNSQTAPVKIYKRSLSGGREDVTLKPDSKYSTTKASDTVLSTYSRSTDRDAIPTDDAFIRNSLFRRSFSGSKDSRSSSRCVNLDECNTYSPRSSHSSEISDKYKTYHSNSSDNSSNLLNRRRYEKDGSVYQSKYYDTLPPRRSITSPSTDYHGRPPSGCLSPQPSQSTQQQQCESPVRRRSSQRRISRFLRPDFFDVPQEESCYVKDRKERDLETQNILKKIRERSRERSLDRREKSAEPFCDRSYYSNIDPITMKDRRKSSIPNLRATSVEPSAGIYHTRTKSENKCCDLVTDNMYLQRRRSLSKPNENYNLPTRSQHSDNVQSNSSFADRILNELQNISIKQIMVGNDAENNKNKVKEMTIRKADPKDIQNLAQQSVDVTDKSKKVSKLARPKSYPSKEQEISKKVSPDKTETVLEKIQESTTTDKTIRPKSYPTTKIASAKEIKNSKNAEVSQAAEDEKLNASRKIMTSKSGAQTTTEQATKKNKISKKNGKSDTAVDQPNDNEEIQTKVPEKKQKTGFLYSIGQKFEKLRENSKNKVLRKSNNKLGTDSNAPAENLEPNGTDVGASKLNVNNQSLETTASDEKSSERKSRIDAMIRNLRERSVTRGPILTESGLIKRAVSVEDLSDTFNKCSVNKVLGLFKKFENNSVQNTKSSSIIDSIVRNEKERPKSSEYMSKQKNGRKYSGAKSDTIVTLTDTAASPPISLDKMNGNSSKIPIKSSNCRDCSEEVDSAIVTKRHSSNGPKQTAEDKERMKQNRKGLVLDFNKIENGDVKHSLASCKNNNNNHNIRSINYNNSNSNINNNNQAPLHPNGILSPSYDSLTNYSSDSRSIHDDCASTSTFLSPTDEPELYFDDWSICSEDNNFTGTTPSPSLSRLSRNSQSSLMGDANASSESVIDRIKRRSFYCRFNENKPKRQSNIVGPAAREYYREAAAKLKSRPPDRVSSPPVMEAHEYYRQLKQKQNNESKSSTSSSSVKSKYDDLKANHRHSDYLLPKSNLNLNLPLPTSSSSRRISTTDNDYKYSHSYLPNARSSVYEPSSLYGTYHSKIKPSSYTTNGTTCLDSYATLGRKPKAYEHRSKSLMDSSIIASASANNSTYKRDHRGTVEYGTLTR